MLVMRERRGGEVVSRGRSGSQSCEAGEQSWQQRGWWVCQAGVALLTLSAEGAGEGLRTEACEWRSAQREVDEVCSWQQQCRKKWHGQGRRGGGGDQVRQERLWPDR